MKVPYGPTIYILLTSYLLRGLNKVSLKYTQGERYYGEAVLLCSVALRPAPLWRETTAVFTFGRQTGSLRAAMFVFVPDT